MERTNEVGTSSDLRQTELFDRPDNQSNLFHSVSRPLVQSLGARHAMKTVILQQSTFFKTVTVVVEASA